MAQAIENDEPRKLYLLLDERARHALISVVKDRRESAALVQAHYPEPERSRTLAQLGDAAQAKDAADLFARRCDAACRAALGAKLGAPRKVTRAGEEVAVTTTRGARLRLYLGSDTWYGFVWQTRALFEERKQAARDAEQIRRNAAHYQRQMRLQQGLADSTEQ